MKKRPEQINRLLGAPGNWTLDTGSDLLFAISGAEPVYGVQHSLSALARNYRQPDWLEPVPRIANEADAFALKRAGFGSASGASSGATFVRT